MNFGHDIMLIWARCLSVAASGGVIHTIKPNLPIRIHRIPQEPSSVLAPSSEAMPFVTTSFLLLVRPGATSSFLLLGSPAPFSGFRASYCESCLVTDAAWLGVASKSQQVSA